MYINTKVMDSVFLHTDMSITRLCEILGVTVRRVQYYWANTFSAAERKARRFRCKEGQHYNVGYSHPNWSGGEVYNLGYKFVVAPSWYTGSVTKVTGYVREHILVYCEANGLTELPIGYCVHHVDEDKLNNALSNLKLMTRSDHTTLHCARRREGGRHLH